MKQYTTVVYHLDHENHLDRLKLEAIKEDFVDGKATGLSVGDLMTKLDRVRELVDGNDEWDSCDIREILDAED